MRFVGSIISVLLAAYALSYWVCIVANPELHFWKKVVEKRDSGIAELREQSERKPIVFFTGGSSTAFSIAPETVEDICDYPAYNLALPIAAGGQYLLHQALRRTQTGDILVVCLEPDVLISSDEDLGCSKFSFGLSSSLGELSEAAGGNTFNTYPTLSDYLSYSRTGPNYLTTYVSKLLTDKGYRYTVDDIRYRGRIETPLVNASMEPASARLRMKLTDQARHMLETVADVARSRGVDVVYTLPWQYTSEVSLAECRQSRRQLLAEIATIMDVVDDGYYGSVSNRPWFSDSPQHLTREGSLIRTRAVSEALKKWMAEEHQ